jgi:hypothetical protein
MSQRNPGSPSARLAQALVALREMAGRDPGARRAIASGLAAGRRLGLAAEARLLMAFASLARWQRARPA